MTSKLNRRVERLEAELRLVHEPDNKITVTLISDEDDPCKTYQIDLGQPERRRRWQSRYSRGYRR